MVVADPPPHAVLVTGGAGFIGAHVCRRLVAEGVARVVVLDDLSSGLATNLDGVHGVELVPGSVLDEPLVERLVADTGAVVHLAAVPAVARSLEDPRRSHDVNVTGTVVVLDAARRAGDRHVVVASSSSVYGAGVRLPADEDLPTRPVSPYAAGKLAAEAYALAWVRSFHHPALALRFFNVYGPLQRADHAYAAVVPAFVAAACAGRPLPVHGDGTQTRDFTYVGDVAALVAAACLERVVTDRPVNVAFGTRTSVGALADELERILGHPLPRQPLPPRPGDVRDSQADSSRLHGLFPSLRSTPLPVGLRATVDWYRSVTDTSGPEFAESSRRRDTEESSAP